MIWSVQAKQGADERFALVNVLPGMLKSLEDMAREQGMSDAAAKSFFAEFSALPCSGHSQWFTPSSSARCCACRAYFVIAR
ncbi:DUF1631 domain-containing protein [Deefgea sp. CFH1-16]|uniref:DUF1631 domain-containing protein n=1 Tax=Deefgea sp. CFH1-16 TaxID=2675457 RepID=UPI001FFC6A79|nr:DUF1631 domain-containing protein [Deefgea sp. CFH1-16]